MAKLNEKVIVVKVSKLLRDSETPGELLSSEIVAQLEEVIKELAGGNVLVEIDQDA